MEMKNTMRKERKISPFFSQQVKACLTFKVSILKIFIYNPVFATHNPLLYTNTLKFCELCLMSSKNWVIYRIFPQFLPYYVNSNLNKFFAVANTHKLMAMSEKKITNSYTKVKQFTVEINTCNIFMKDVF